MSIIFIPDFWRTKNENNFGYATSNARMGGNGVSLVFFVLTTFWKDT